MPTEVQVQYEEATPSRAVVGDKEKRQPFRVRAIMRQGTAASLPGTWERYLTIEDARAGTRHLYHDDRVLRVMIVSDDVPPRFVEWVER